MFAEDASEELLERRATTISTRRLPARRQLLLLLAAAFGVAIVGGAVGASLFGPSSDAVAAAPGPPAPRPDTPAGDPCRYAPLSWPCAPSLEASKPAQPFAFKKVMVVTAHPDDESMASGYLAHLSRMNPPAQIRFVVSTNGDKGSGDYNMTSPRLRQIRAREMHNAAAALGGTAVLLDYEDGELDVGHSPEAGGLSGRSTRYELRLRLAAQIRLFEPELLITFNPVPNFDEYQRGTQHKDHQWIGHEALACFYPIARDHLQFPELWDRTHWPALRRNFSEMSQLTDAQFEKMRKGWKIPEAYLFTWEQHSASTPRYETVFVPLELADLQQAAQSLSQHVSQVGGQSAAELLAHGSIKDRRAPLGRMSTPPSQFAEWYIRVVNML